MGAVAVALERAGRGPQVGSERRAITVSAIVRVIS